MTAWHFCTSHHLFSRSQRWQLCGSWCWCSRSWNLNYCKTRQAKTNRSNKALMNTLFGVLLSVLLYFGCCLVPNLLPQTHTDMHTHLPPHPTGLCRSPNIIPADYTPIPIKSSLQGSSPPWLTPTAMHCNVFSMCLFSINSFLFLYLLTSVLYCCSLQVSLFLALFFFLCLSLLFCFTVFCLCNDFHVNNFLWIASTDTLKKLY